jgi:hypothetical protein
LFDIAKFSQPHVTFECTWWSWSVFFLFMF